MYDLLMMLGAMTGCHQMPERSFFFKGYQFPLCARCTGILIGELLALPSLLLFQPSLPLAIALIVPMACDGMLQYVFSVMSNNVRRAITGLLAGYGYTSLYVGLFLMLVRYLKAI